LTDNYILNKVSHKKLEKIPYKLWKGRSPFYKYLKMWGCLEKKMAIPDFKKVKTGLITMDFVFSGYDYNCNSYRFFEHKSIIEDIYPNTIIK